MLGALAARLLRGLLSPDVLSVVIPTLSGREDSLARAIASYRETLDGVPHEIIVEKDRPSWPAACNAGYRKAKGDVLHFTADDLEALPGWWVEVLPWLAEHDELPAPRVLNSDGSWDNAVDGEDGGTPHFTRIPLMTRSQYERIGPWPEFNYVADVWLSEKGRTVGIETRMFHSYAFVHHWEQVGRRDSPDDLAIAHSHLTRLRAAL
jgi:hypothetical protein